MLRQKTPPSQKKISYFEQQTPIMEIIQLITNGVKPFWDSQFENMYYWIKWNACYDIIAENQTKAKNIQTTNSILKSFNFCFK